MSDLFPDDLPEGCKLFRGFVDERLQDRLVRLSRQLLVTHPLATPTTKSGHPMALKVSSWGAVGWWGEGGRYRYVTKHPDNRRAWPDIPDLLNNVLQKVLVEYGHSPIRFQTVLLNWYPRVTGRLGKHQDITEQDQVAPIITISLGDSCKFVIGTETYQDKGQSLILNAGDVFVMGGASRLVYHEVQSIIPASGCILEHGGRISLTARRVFKI